MSMTEILLGLIITIIVVSGVAFVFTNAREKNNQQRTMTSLLQMRASIEQLFNNGNYEGLANSILLTAGIVPAEMRKGANIITSWGNVAIAATSDNSGYTIQLESLNPGACQALASLSPTSWAKVEVNGTTLYDRSVNEPINNVTLVNSCASTTNTVAYTAP